MTITSELIERSNRLGSDPRNTNYAGGNTSAKGTAVDPVTGEDVELLWVKGSGGDLGTLQPNGLAVLRLDRLRALQGVYPGVAREDEMVTAFDFGLHGKGGAAPPIDTAMHGLVDAPHVDHLHPDSGKPGPFGPIIPGYQPLPEVRRRARAAALAPAIRGLASTDRPQAGHYTDSDVVLDFLSRAGHPRLAALGTSCPDHFLRTKVRPMVLDLPPDAPLQDVVTRLRELHGAYRADYAAYYRQCAGPSSPPMRGADPAIVLVPGIGMFSYGATKQTARVAGEFYLNAINVMRGAEALSAYAPIDEAEKFRIEYWALEEAKLARTPPPKPLATRIALVTGAGSGIGRRGRVPAMTSHEARRAQN